MYTFRRQVASIRGIITVIIAIVLLSYICSACPGSNREGKAIPAAATARPVATTAPRATAMPATQAPKATATSAPVVKPTVSERANCDPAYPGVCIPPPPPDLDCGNIPYRKFRVLPPDPHQFDRDGDGIGCES